MSKDLSSNASSNYLKTSVNPRIFVKISGANLFLGTKALTETSNTYTNSLKKSGTITSSIKPFGGVATVSGVEIANLELGNELTFCTDTGTTLEPIGAPGEPVGAGRLMKTGDLNESYSDVRGDTEGTFDTPFVTVGQRKFEAAGNETIIIYRGCLQFEIPEDLTSCEDATLCLYGNQDKSDTDYEIRIIQGTWDTWATDGMFNDFDGHESGDTAYDETEDTDSPALNETWRTYSFSTSSTIPNYIRFNLIGRELIESTAGSKLKLLLLSERDFDGDEPSGDEFVLFNVHNAYLRLRYNTYDLYNKEAIIYLAFCDTDGSDLVTDVDDMQRLWTGVVDDYSINERTLNLSLRQNNFKKNVVIPKNIITKQIFSITVANDVLVLTYDGGDATNVDVADGIYSGAEAATALKNAIDAAFGITSTVTCNATTRKFTIDVGGGHTIAYTHSGSDGGLTYGYNADHAAAQTITSNIAFDDFSDCPDVNIGKPYPQVYGDFTTVTTVLKHKNGMGRYQGSITSVFGEYDYGYTNNFLKGIVVKDSKSKKVLLSEYGMKDSANPYYFWNNTREVFELFPVSPSADTPSDTEVIETLVPDTTGFPHHLIAQYYSPVQTLIPSRHGTFGSPTNAANAYDSDPDTYAVLTSVNDTIYFYFDSPPGVSIGRWFSIVAYIDYVGGAADPSVQIQLQYTRDGGSNWDNWATGADWVNWDGGWTAWRKYFPPSQTYNLSSYSDMRFYFWRNVAGSGSCRLKNVALISGYSSGEITELFTSGQGMEFGSWIDDGVSEGLSVPRDNSKNEDDLIELPGFTIESIARDSMGLTNSEINTTFFDSLATDLANWEFAFQLLERKDSMKLIGELAEQCKTSLWWDEEDKLKAKMFDKDTAFPNADDNTPDVPGNLDIFDEAASVTSGAFTTHPILEKGSGVVPFEMFKMGMDETKNDFILHYKKNWATGGRYFENLYITNGAGTEGSVNTNITAASLEDDQDLTNTGNLKQLTSDNYNAISTTNTWEYEAWAVRDSATANKLLQHFIERLTKNRWKIKFTTGLNAIGVELGDFICVKHHRLQDIFGVPTERIKKWEVIRINHNLDAHNITLTAIEV